MWLKSLHCRSRWNATMQNHTTLCNTIICGNFPVLLSLQIRAFDSISVQKSTKPKLRSPGKLAELKQWKTRFADKFCSTNHLQRVAPIRQSTGLVGNVYCRGTLRESPYVRRRNVTRNLVRNTTGLPAVGGRQDQMTIAHFQSSSRVPKR